MAFVAEPPGLARQHQGLTPRQAHALRCCEKMLGSRAQSVVDVTPLPTAGRTVFRVDLTDGQRVKLRLSDHSARRVKWQELQLMRVIPGQFPALLACQDGWSAYEWITGSTIAATGALSAVVPKAAAMLCAIHQGNAAPGGETQLATADVLRDQIEASVVVLEKHQLLSAKQSAAFRSLADTELARSWPLSLIHGDFAPANLVVSEGRLVSVDNEKLGCRSATYDLCRAINFWDEWNGSGNALCAAYQSLSGRETADRHLLFWKVFDLANRISFQLRHFGEPGLFCQLRLNKLLAVE